MCADHTNSNNINDNMDYQDDPELLDTVKDFSKIEDSDDDDIQLCNIVFPNSSSFNQQLINNNNISHRERNNNNNINTHSNSNERSHKSEPQEVQQRHNLEHCSICLNDPPINAIKLNCKHIFCFLCVKGAAENNNRCPICRSEITQDFWFNQHQIIGATRIPTATQDGKYWFYEAYDGWWMYDPETAKEIEQAYQMGNTKHEQLIAGFIYCIDYEKMVQRRRDGYSRSRKIRRATLNLENIKGVAGIKNNDLLSTIKLLKDSVGS